MPTPKRSAQDPRTSSKELTTPKAPAADPMLQNIGEPERAGRRRIDEDVLANDMTPVRVNVPSGFMLHHPQGVHTTYAAGEQDMPKCHAEHSYALAVGVAPVKKAKKADAE